MMRQLFRGAVAATLMFSVSGCSDLLEVENKNNPDTDRVISTPADVERLIADSYNTWFVGAFACCAVGIQQQAMAGEMSPMAANYGMIERSQIPRIAPINTTSDQFSGNYYQDYSLYYRAISNATDGIKQLDAGLTIGSAEADNRARAWARFVQGISHGYIALTYDSLLVVDETTDLSLPPVFVGSADGIAAALGYLDDAIAIATANTFDIPDTWMPGANIDNSDFVRLARTYKAKLRANAARTPADVAGIDWNAVIADASNGITADFEITSDYNNWYFGQAELHSLFGPWNQVNMQYMGMADTTGAYQAWAAVLPITARVPFTLATPDLRWPRGANDSTQQVVANRGTYMRNKGSSGHVRSDRGTWRWSKYSNNRYQAFYNAGYIGDYPVVQKSEMDLLLAEAYIRTGQEALALPLINAYRTAAGLPDVTLAGVPNVASCVPRLPDGTCGSLLEALKYEKRIETMYSGTWYFDSRRWGDLPTGTPVDYPVPARELETLGFTLYTRGGVGLPGGSAPGTYGF